MNPMITLNVPDSITCTGEITGTVTCNSVPVSGIVVTFSSDPAIVTFLSNPAITNENGQVSTTVTVPEGTDLGSVSITATTTVNGVTTSETETTTVSCPPVTDDNPVSFPITQEQVPTETAGGLFSFVSVQAYYLPGADITRNGNDRFREDMKNASQTWGFPIIREPGGPIHLTANDLGPSFSLPSSLTNLKFDNASFKRLQEIHAAKFPGTVKVIAVWYAPFSEQTGGEIGKSFNNIGFPNQNSTSRFFQHIVINNTANNGNNNSTLLHELGHTFFYTASIEDPKTGRLIPQNNKCDPASPNCSDTHNTLSNNIMNSAAGNKTELVNSQRQKASSTFLFL